MDHRSGSASQGTSPLKAAGFLVGLLVVVALAFALGMKAGRELDVLRPERGGDTVKLAEARSETDPLSETTGRARRDDAPPKHTDTVATKPASGEGADARRDATPPSSQEARGANATTPEPVGDEPPRSSPAAEPPVERKTPPSASPSPDYTIFSKAPGGAKASAGNSPPDVAAPSEPAGKASAAKPAEAVKPVKETPAPPQAKVAVAKPTASTASKPSATPPNQSQLKISSESQSGVDKAGPGFVVQVAAYQTKAEADQLVTRIRAHGSTPYISKIELPNGTWYRVRVGKYKTTAEAKAAQKKLAGAGFRSAEVMSAR